MVIRLSPHGTLADKQSRSEEHEGDRGEADGRSHEKRDGGWSVSSERGFES